MDNQTTDPAPPPAAVPSLMPDAAPPSLPAPTPKPKSKKIVLIVVAIVLVFLVALSLWLILGRKPKPTTTSTLGTANIGASVLHVGTTIDENGAAEDAKEFQPFLNYLKDQLKGKGISKVEFVPENSVAEAAKDLKANRMDLYVDSVFPIFVADRLAGSQLIADRWKEGVEKYRSAIFVKAASPIKTVADLKGRIIAMDSNNSTAGYFLPKAELLKSGYKLSQKQSPHAVVSANEVGYEFVHDKVFDDVANGVLPAGAESEQEIRDNFGASFNQDYRIIMTSPYVIRFGVAARKGLDHQLLASIKTTLFSMDQSDVGKYTLQKFADTARFTSVGTDTSAAYGEIQKLTNYVQKEIINSGN